MVGTTVTWYFGRDGRRVGPRKRECFGRLRMGERVVIGAGVCDRTSRLVFVGEAEKTEVPGIAPVQLMSEEVDECADEVCSSSGTFGRLVLTRSGRVMTLSEAGLRIAMRLCLPSCPKLADVGVRALWKNALSGVRMEYCEKAGDIGVKAA